MGIHSSHARILAVAAVLALAAGSTARAQDTSSVSGNDSSAAARSDTSGYQQYQNKPADTTQTDSSGFKYNGPPTDTTLKAKPGAQTGRNANDTSSTTGAAGEAGTADTVVCKDGSQAVGASACDAAHGGIDSVATSAAKKARSP